MSPSKILSALRKDCCIFMNTMIYTRASRERIKSVIMAAGMKDNPEVVEET
jgi:hypothetical protein